MRITEQIDALEIMGVNSASYLILPKIIATMFFFPLLAAFSMIVGVVGGFLVAWMGVLLPSDYMDGLLYCFDDWEVTYSLIKMTVFAFLITSISGFYGYYAKGNSLEVGRASTRAVVTSSIMIMASNLILTQLLRA
jgi:phospholipid/cholesterol/gamma-HCH transport system permease protein